MVFRVESESGVSVCTKADLEDREMKYLRQILVTLIAAGLVVLAASPALARVVVVNQAALEHAIGIQEFHTDDLMAMDGVVGTAVGVAGDGAPVIKVFTESRDITGVPRRLDGIPVVVQVTGKLYALHHRPGHGGGPGDDNDDPPLPVARRPPSDVIGRCRLGCRPAILLLLRAPSAHGSPMELTFTP